MNPTSRPLEELPSQPKAPQHVRVAESYLGKSHAVKFLPDNWANSTTALKIRSLIFKTLSILSKPFNATTHEYYTFRMKRVDAKLINIKNNKILDSVFGKYRQPGAMNIAQKSASLNQESILKQKSELSQKLLSEVQKKHAQAKVSEAPVKELITEGICFGIMVDLADHYLESNGNKELMEQCFLDLEKGGSSRAEIYQGAIQGIQAPVSKTFVIEALQSSIEDLKNDTATSTLSKLLPYVDNNHQTSMKNFIFNLEIIDKNNPSFMGNIRNNASYSNLLLPSSSAEEVQLMTSLQKSKSETQQFGLTYLMANAFESLKNEDRSKWTEKNNGKEALNIPHVQGKMMEHLDKVFNQKIQTASPEQRNFLTKRREQLIGEIKLAAASQEYYLKGKITDPLLNEVVENTNLLIRQEALLAVKGLSMNPCTDIMGNHMQFRDDAGYLNNLDKLDKGFYLLAIKTQGGAGHAVSFIKEADGSGYLIDPNDRKLKFSNASEAKELANKLTSLYSEPSSKIPGHPYHKLSFFKIEKNSEKT